MAEIDPAVADTAALVAAHGVPADASANCVVVAGRREGVERIAACVVLATTRADVNGLVRRLLDVRKASFLTMDRAVAETGMEYGGITAIGVPPEWRVLVDARVPRVPVARDRQRGAPQQARPARAAAGRAAPGRGDRGLALPA